MNVTARWKLKAARGRHPSPLVSAITATQSVSRREQTESERYPRVAPSLRLARSARELARSFLFTCIAGKSGRITSRTQCGRGEGARAIICFLVSKNWQGAERCQE